MFLFLFLLLLIFRLAIPLLKNTKLRLVLLISAGASITVANEEMETPSLVADKPSKVLSK